MEPTILVIGRLQSTLDVLVEKWEKFGRTVFASNAPEGIKKILAENKIDLVAMGAGLPDEKREEMKVFIATIDSNPRVHLLPRDKAEGPHSIIPFVNNLAVNFKVRMAMEKEKSLS